MDANLSVRVKKDGMPIEYMVFKDPALWFGKKTR